MAYKEGKKERPPFLPQPVAQEPEKPQIPRELKCQLCQDLMTDAVVIPCCGNSYCDECIRTALLETEDHRCPTCHQKGVSPNGIIPNNSLRSAVQAFTNDSGYSKARRLSTEKASAHSSQPPTPTSHGPQRRSHLARSDHSLAQDAHSLPMEQHHTATEQAHHQSHDQQLHSPREQHRPQTHSPLRDQHRHNRIRDPHHPRRDRLLSEHHRMQGRHLDMRSQLPVPGHASSGADTAGQQIQSLSAAQDLAGQPSPSSVLVVPGMHPAHQPMSVLASLTQAPPVYVSSTLTATSAAGYSPPSLHSSGAGVGYEDDGSEQGIPVLGKPASKGRGKGDHEIIARHVHAADAAQYTGAHPVSAVVPTVPAIAYATPPPGYPAYSVPPPGYAYPSNVSSVYAVPAYPQYAGIPISTIPVSSGEDSTKNKPKTRDIYEDFAKDLLEKGRERPFKHSRSRSRSRSYTPRESRRWSHGRSWSSRSRSRSYKSRSRSRSPRRLRSRSRLRSLSRGRSLTPLRRSWTRSVSLGRGKSRSVGREKSRSPVRDRSRSQESGRYRSRTPDGGRYRSPVKGKSRSPSGSKFRSPRRGTSRSPARGTPRSTSRGRSKSWSRSPRGRSRSRTRSFTPKRRNQSFSHSPRSPRRKSSRSLSHSRSRSWSSPRPRSKSFSPQRIKSPLRPKPFRRSVSPYQNRSMSPSYRHNGPSPPPAVRGLVRGRGRARGRGRRGEWVPLQFRSYGSDRGHRMMHQGARFPVPYHNMLPEEYYRQAAQYEQYYRDYYSKYGPNAPPPQPPPWAPNFGPIHMLPVPAGGWQPPLHQHQQQQQPHRPLPLQSQIQQRPPPQHQLSPLKEQPASQEREKRRSATPEPPGVDKQPGAQPSSVEDKREFHRDPGRDFGKEPNPEQGRDFAREQGREQGRDYPRDQNRDYARDHGRDYPREQNRDYHREQPRDYHREAGRDFSRDYPRDLVRDYSREPGRDGAKEHNRDHGKEYYRDPNHRDYRREVGRDYGREYPKEQGRDYYKDSVRDFPRDRDHRGRGESREFSKERERSEKDHSSDDRKKKVAEKHSKKESKGRKIRKKTDKSADDKDVAALKKKSAAKHASSSDEKGASEKKMKTTPANEAAQKPTVKKKIPSGKVKKKVVKSESKQVASDVLEASVSKNLIQVPIGTAADSGDNLKSKSEVDSAGSNSQAHKPSTSTEKAPPKKVVKRIKKLKVAESKTESSSASESEKTKLKPINKVSGDSSGTKLQASDQGRESGAQDGAVENTALAVKGEEKGEPREEAVLEVAAEEGGQEMVSIKKEDAGRDQLLLPPPEPSKWEQDDLDWNTSDIQNPRKRAVQTEKKTFLPRSVLNRAEKYITQKPVRPAVAPAVSRASPSRAQRRVYVEENDGQKRDDREERKVKTNRSSSLDMQITITKSDKRSPDNSHPVKTEVRRSHDEGHRTVIRAGEESGHEKSSRRQVSGEHSTKKRSFSPQREEQDAHRRDLRQRDDRLSKEDRRSRKPSSEKESGGSKTKDLRHKLEQARSKEGSKTTRSLDRKESVIDEAKFEPDYEEMEESSVESDSEGPPTAEQHSTVSTEETSDMEEGSQPKKARVEDDDKSGKKSKHKKSKHKKHKHKNKKKKHRKHKEKGEKL